MSLWQEIGEEFVEFLEKELNITDTEASENNNDQKFTEGFPTNETKEAASIDQKGSSKSSNIDDIEATLAQLKKELGLEWELRNTNHARLENFWFWFKHSRSFVHLVNISKLFALQFL